MSSENGSSNIKLGTRALNRATARALAELKRTAFTGSQPATDGRLARIWPVWFAFPAEFDCGERIAILTGKQLHYGDYRQHYERLCMEFKALLPLSVSEYQRTLDALAEWWRLMEASRSCIAANVDEIGRQLRYESFDKNLVGFVAQHRVFRELAVEHPNLLDADKCPTLADIKFVRARRDAYLKARRDALMILSHLIFSRSLLRESQHLQEISETNFPKHLYIARLKAFGKCSDRRWTWFMKWEFPKLSHKQQREFHMELRKPHIGGENFVYLRVWAWLAENAPVFNLCNAGWPDIFKEVKLRFKVHAPAGCRACPADYEHLKILWRTFAKNHGLNTPPRIKPPIGPPRSDRRPFLSALLTRVTAISPVESAD